jgi:phage shock protein PspC (stress-responsive transcriptional regulator)
MKEIIRKLSSRKLWLALAGVAAGIAMALGADATEIQSIAGAVTAIVGVVTYIVTEGKIDAERVKVAIEETQKAVETIERTDSE